MALFDDEPLRPKKVHEIGQDLSLLSVHELEERILQLKSEITRLENALSSKSSSRIAAESLFRR